MDRLLRIGLVGCGNHMFNIIYNCLKALPVELVAICDIDRQKLDRFSKTYTVDIVDNIRHLEYNRPGQRRDNCPDPLMAEGSDIFEAVKTMELLEMFKNSIAHTTQL